MINIRSKIINWIFKVAYKIKPRYASDIMYRRAFHKKQNLDNPQNLIEKINWLQFNSDTAMWTLCADKYRMREYVDKCGLNDYMPKLYGHWNKAEDIDFEDLPNEFVLKSNNGCGTVKIVRDKSQLDIPATRKLLNGWLKPYGYIGGQSHYMRIKPCIIAEELLHQDEEQKAFSPDSMVDYKVWCINGKPESILVVFNRHDALQVNIALFDTEWNAMPQYLQSTKLDVYDPNYTIPKPITLDEMLKVATKLSKPFPEVRVDFYEVDSKPVVGELTFTTGYGYFTEEYYEMLGNKLKINDINKLGG